MTDPRTIPEPDPELPDPSLLFDDAPRAEPARPPAPGFTLLDADDGYAIEGPEPDPVAAPLPAPPIERPRERASAKDRAKPKRPASSGVEQPWSRGAEWGVDLARLGIGLAVVLGTLYLTFNPNALLLWSLLLFGGLGVLAVLAYPIFITLERPVRVTPEQAIQDYFAALSHFVPHYRRMWLLLATDGHLSPHFSTFDAFRAYWKGRLALWKASAGRGGTFNPFEVRVVDFKGDKSAGATEIEASYTAVVVLRGAGDAPIATYPASLRLVKGDDRMWYLESGTLGD